MMMKPRETFEEAISRVEAILGEQINRPVAEHDGWHFGERVRIIDDDDDKGVFAGDEGHVVIEKVGAPEYGNVRTCVAVLVDGTDAPTEVGLDNIEPAD